MVLFLILLLLIGIASLSVGCFQLAQSMGMPFKNPKMLRMAKLAKILITTGIVLIVFCWWAFHH